MKKTNKKIKKEREVLNKVFKKAEEHIAKEQKIIDKENSDDGMKKRIKEYIPIISEDRDWDYTFILVLLQYKLKRTRENIERSDYHKKEIKKLSQQISQVENLIDRVINFDYNKYARKEFTKKYGKCSLVRSEPDELGNIPVEFCYTKEKGHDKNNIRKESLKCTDLALKMQKDDLKKAFHIMSENIWSWWS